MEWELLNWLNVFCIFFSTYVAVKCWSGGSNLLGHFNMAAAVLNVWIVASRLGF